MTLVRDVDEFELIRRFKEVLPASPRAVVGSGDDCAVIAAPEGHYIVSTDIVIENEHWLRRWSTAREVGERAAAQNLADIAAMGGRVSSVVVCLTSTKDEEVEWLVDLVAGFGARVGEAGGGVDGGDLSKGDRVVVAVTVMGWCDGEPLLRSGAQPGDVVAVAGTMGRSAAGLDLLLEGHVAPALHSPEELGDLYEAVSIYRAPLPPLEAGPAALAAGAHAMMDLSDGLAKDGARMARASNVRIEIDRDALQVDVDALAAPARVTGKDALHWVITGGEDHGMFAAFPSDVVLPEGFRVIGRVAEADEAGPGCFMDGVELRGGWDHFKQDACITTSA